MKKWIESMNESLEVKVFKDVVKVVTPYLSRYKIRNTPLTSVIACNLIPQKFQSIFWTFRIK